MGRIKKLIHASQNSHASSFGANWPFDSCFGCLRTSDQIMLKQARARMSRSSLALSNLRAAVILIVLAFHSCIAYLDSLPSSAQPFNSPPYQWRSFPIIDSQRWFGLDLFCAPQDVYLMSLMFFLSGVFVWPSLARKGSWDYMWHRVLRLGLPFGLAVFLLMPVAHYPVYLVTAVDPSVAAFWQSYLALPFWPSGPPWFLWQLLVLNIVAAGVYRLSPGWEALLGKMASLGAHPSRFFAGLVTASALVYVPLAIEFTPWEWSQLGPFGLQLSRPLHYAVYFFAGLGIGIYGIENGLLASDGLLARRWAMWLAAAFAAFLLWITPTALIFELRDAAPLGLQIIADLGFVLSCASSSFFLVAVFLHFARNRSRVLDSLSRNAYGMYLVHYVFVVWLQYALLNAPLFAFAKAAIVFGVTLVLSWATSAALRRLPLLGLPRGAIAKGPMERA
jgi:glucan biosynthesis protein C